jgi:hypothetical protein
MPISYYIINFSEYYSWTVDRRELILCLINVITMNFSHEYS